MLSPCIVVQVRVVKHLLEKGDESWIIYWVFTSQMFVEDVASECSLIDVSDNEIEIRVKAKAQEQGGCSKQYLIC